MTGELKDRIRELARDVSPSFKLRVKLLCVNDPMCCRPKLVGTVTLGAITTTAGGFLLVSIGNYIKLSNFINICKFLLV